MRLVDLPSTAKSARVRLTTLQFFFALCADSDNRLYLVYGKYDRFESIAAFAGLIGKVRVADIPASSSLNEQPAHEEQQLVVDPREILSFHVRTVRRVPVVASETTTTRLDTMPENPICDSDWLLSS
jgi:hypothetical protein